MKSRVTSGKLALLIILKISLKSEVWYCYCVLGAIDYPRRSRRKFWDLLILLKNPWKIRELTKQMSWKIRKIVLESPGFSINFYCGNPEKATVKEFNKCNSPDLINDRCGCKLWSNLYKMPWSTLRCWTTVVKNCKGLTLKLKVKYLFPTLSSGPNYIYQLLEYLEMRKML